MNLRVVREFRQRRTEHKIQNHENNSSSTWRQAPSEGCPWIEEKKACTQETNPPDDTSRQKHQIHVEKPLTRKNFRTGIVFLELMLMHIETGNDEFAFAV